MNRVFIFDVDGTLTPSRRPMTKDFEKFFVKWSKNNPFWLVSGSDLDKMREQITDFIFERAEGLFTCSANQLYIDEELIYENREAILYGKCIDVPY